MSTTIAGFDWDAGNETKCGKHGVSSEEIEALLTSGVARWYPDVVHSDTEVRHLAIGRGPSGRYVFVAFTLRSREGATWIRPISTRFMHQREIERYEEADPDAPHG